MAKRSSKGLWVVQFLSPDSSNESTEAYSSREEAIEHVCQWIAYNAKDELDGIEWEDGDQAPELLKDVLLAIKENRPDDAVAAWLEYQGEYDPSERISLGPSGEVSPRASDFDR